MTATPPIRLDHRLRLVDTPKTHELKTGYGWCDRHQGFAFITRPTANDPKTGIHGACKGCVDGRPPTKRL